MIDSLVIAGPLMIAAIVMAVRFVGCGLDDSPLPGNGDNGDGDRDGKPPSGGTPGDLNGFGRLTAKVSFPQNKPETQEYDTAGPYTYPIPYWCTTIDLILLGAGGGGSYNDFGSGVGGGGGKWEATTLQRGSDIPWAAKAIAITVGAGGTGATPNSAASSGGDTTATWDTTSGPASATAKGGDAGGTTGAPTGAGPTPASQTQGGATLTAGPDQTAPAGPGNPPGGGGAGGDVISPGGAGADGAAILVASQS